MGFFTKQNDQGKTRLRTGAVLSTVAGLAAAWYAATSSYYINPDKQATLEIFAGSIVDRETTSGYKFKNPLSTVESFSLAPQRTSAIRADSVLTLDSLSISGTFSVEYEIDTATDLDALHFRLRDSDTNLDAAVKALAANAAEHAIGTLTIQDIPPESGSNGQKTTLTDKIAADIRAHLQESLKAEGWPVRLVSVSPDRFSVSPESMKAVNDIIAIETDRKKLELCTQNAQKAAELFRQEADAYTQFINVFRQNAGLPDGGVAAILAQKMKQSEGRVNANLSEHCGGINAPRP